MSGSIRFSRLFLVLFLTLTLVFIYSHGATKPRANPRAGSGGGAAVRVDQSSGQGVAMTVELTEFGVEPAPYGGGEYNIVRVPGAKLLSQPGEPDVPVIRRYVGVPMCDDVVVDYRIVKESRRTLDIAPARATDKEGNYLPETASSPTYSRDARFPGSVAEVKGIYQIRDQRVAVLDIYPVQYNPRSGEVLFAEEIEISLTFTNPQGTVIRNVGPMQRLMEGVLVNYNATGPAASDVFAGQPNRAGEPGELCLPTGNNWVDVANEVIVCGVDYLIIAANDLDGILLETLALKHVTQNGYNVAIVRMNQIDPDPDTQNTPLTIYSFIESVYSSQTAEHMADGYLGYVLLVGDAYDRDDLVLIPSYYGYGTEASDAYYSFLSGGPDDLLADVFLGRLPVNLIPGHNPNQQLEYVVNKIMAYDRAPTDPLTNLMVSGNQSGVHGADVVRYFVEEVQEPYIPPEVQTEIIHRYYDDPYKDWPDAQFSSFLAGHISDNDYWLVSIYGHGNPMYPGNTLFPDDYKSLSNELSTLFLLNGCEMGKFDYQEGGIYACMQDSAAGIDPCDAMAEALLIQEHGAVGTLAYTKKPSGSHCDDAMEGFYESIFHEYSYTLGEILYYIRLYDFNPADYTNPRYLTLFGDPALDIWREAAPVAVDFAVRKANMRVANGYHASNDNIYFNTGEPIRVEAVVENLGQDAATDVTVRFWDGHPDDPGSTVLDSVVVPSLPGFEGQYTVTLNLDFEVGAHEVYVEVDPSGYTEAVETNNITGISFNAYAYDYSPGFPVSGAIGAVTIADVDPTHPGAETIVLNNLKSLVCYASTGEHLWTWTAPDAFEHFSSSTPPCVGNLYKNGVPYCVVVGRVGLWVVNARTGELDWSYPFPQLNFFFYTEGQNVLLTDLITDDSSLEIVLLFKGPNASYQRVEAYTMYIPDGSDTYLRWQVDVGLALDALRSELAAGDIDGDGDKEIVVIGADYQTANKLLVIHAPNDATGTPPAPEEAEVPGNGALRSVALVRALGADPHLDIMASGGPSYTQVSRLDKDLNPVPGYTPEVVGPDMPWFTIADVDGDGDDEIVAASDENLMILSAQTGAVIHSTTVPGKFKSFPLTADVDGDGYLEVVMFYRSGSNDRLQLQVFEENLSLLGTAQELPVVIDGEQSFAVDDIDGDGSYEVVFVTSDSVLHAIRIGSAAGREGWTQRFRYATQTNRVVQPLAGDYYKDVSLSGDVHVEGSARLHEDFFVDAGAEIGVGGSYATLITYGAAVFAGAENDRIQLFASSDNPTGTWGGYVPYTGTPVDIDYCDIQDGIYGILNFADIDVANVDISDCQYAIYTFGPIGVSNVTFSDCANGIYFAVADPPYSQVQLDNVWFDNVPVAVKNDNPGWTLVTSMSGDYDTGIQVNADLTIEDSHLFDGTGTGIRVAAGVEATIVNTTVEDQGDGGILIDNCDPASSVTGSDFSGNSEYAIKITNAGDVLIQSCDFVENVSHAIECEGSSPTITGCLIKKNNSGIRCTESSPVIRDCVIYGNDIGVVTLDPTSIPDIGTVADHGDNDFAGPALKGNDMNIAALAPVDDIYAQYNWWGTTDPVKIQQKIVVAGGPPGSGTVIFIPFKQGAGAQAPPRQDGGGETSDVPDAEYLAQNHPNPFNPTTTIRFGLKERAAVTVRIYNASGQLVRELVNTELGAGHYERVWDGTSRHGEPVASGVYFYRLTTPSFVETRKMVLLK
jgi:hypothetical protein